MIYHAWMAHWLSDGKPVRYIAEFPETVSVGADQGKVIAKLQGFADPKKALAFADAIGCKIFEIVDETVRPVSLDRLRRLVEEPPPETEFRHHGVDEIKS